MVSSDAKEVRAAVQGEVEPLDRLAASLYNKPAVPTFTEKYEEPGPWGSWSSGTRFLRWHELSDEQKDKVRANLRKRLEELGVDVTRSDA